MQPGEALGIATQVAVTLAGFAGIVVVFRPESVHEWSALDRFRLHLLLANSALPLVSSLFGILLLTIDPAPVAIWRWCSGFVLLIQVPFILSTSAKGRRIPPMDKARVEQTALLLDRAAWDRARMSRSCSWPPTRGFCLPPGRHLTIPPTPSICVARGRGSSGSSGYSLIAMEGARAATSEPARPDYRRPGPPPWSTSTRSGTA